MQPTKAKLKHSRAVTATEATKVATKTATTKEAISASMQTIQTTLILIMETETATTKEVTTTSIQTAKAVVAVIQTEATETKMEAIIQTAIILTLSILPTKTTQKSIQVTKDRIAEEVASSTIQTIKMAMLQPFQTIKMAM